MGGKGQGGREEGREAALAVAVVGPERGAALVIAKKKAKELKRTRKEARKRRQVVLDEEAYLESLDKIIERDFFPDLPLVDAQLAYLQAVEKNDARGMAALQRHIRRIQEGQSAPGGAESAQGGGTAAEGVAGAAAAEMGLDEFHGRHTSEDNRSFEELVEKQRQEEKRRDVWRLEQKARGERQLLLKGEERCELSGLLTWKYKNKNNLMYLAASAAPLTAAEEARLLGPPKEIRHANTRLDAGQAASTFGGRSGGGRGGRSGSLLGALQRDYLASPGRPAPPRSPSEGGSPRVNGYGFVCTPEPCEDDVEERLAGWGDVASAPVPMPRVSAADRAGAAYRIPATPTRDKVALELAEKSGRRAKGARAASRRIAASSVRYERSPYTPAFATPRASATPLSPAAARLLSIRSKRATPGGSGLGDIGLRASYSAKTPVRTPTAARRRAATPRPAPRPKGSGVTDDLLQL